MYKIILLVVFLALYVESHSETLLDELIERIEVKRLMNDNLDDKCTDAGIKCYSKYECNDCGQAGRCIKDAIGVKCMCWWGWTGPNARRTDYGNHILADSCGDACHYTHDHWNPKCLLCPGCGNPQCDEYDCNGKHGKCINDECVCDDTKCGYEGGVCKHGQCHLNIISRRSNNPLLNDNLDDKCTDAGIKCYSKYECSDCGQAGRCIKERFGVKQKCMCWWGWTGPNARRADYGNHILADSCGEACHYTHDHWNPECLIETIEEKRMMNDNLDDKCTDAGIKCYSKSECSDCGQAGRCIKDAIGVKCMCWWGWTGPNARRADNGNHILADSCGKACHYTHDHWNPKCLLCPGCGNPQCDEDDCNKIHGKCINDQCVCDDTKCENEGGVCKNGQCKKCDNCDHGKCIKGVCHIKCCRNITPFSSPFNGGQFKKHCEDRCKWIEEMPGACTPTPIEPCNPKCAKSGGQCDTKTGRCKCCKDFTGPGAMLIGDSIYADYCDVFCDSSNELCVNEDYVKRCKLP